MTIDQSQMSNDPFAGEILDIGENRPFKPPSGGSASRASLTGRLKANEGKLADQGTGIVHLTFSTIHYLAGTKSSSYLPDNE
ncbi:MAG: hypothetical protein ABI977_35385 [Acidobacteriota bacterium]